MNSSRQLLHSLQKIGLPPAVIREFLQACLGHKVSRTSLSDRELHAVASLLENHGLYVGVSRAKYFACPDMGKGGWCNAAPIELDAGSPMGEHFIYAGTDPQKVFRAMQSEEQGADTDFAESLGIPSCCAEFYVNNVDAARIIQNDLLPFTFRNSMSGYPFNLWANSASQYFGYGLNSFFPCSFHCNHAADAGRNAYSALESVDSSFAGGFLEAQNANYFYSEYDGIFQLPGSSFDGQNLTYDATRLKGTSNGILASALRRGNAIEVVDSHHYRLRSGASVLMDIRDELTCLLVFSPS